MKKILIAVLVLLSAQAGYAQNGALTIKNHTTDCTANILVYARSATLHTPVGCSDLVTGGSIGAGGFMLGTNPGDWQANYFFGGSITSVCIGPCPSYPSDFDWTTSNIDLNCPCGISLSSVNVGNNLLTSPACITSTTSATGCAGHYIEWIIGASAPYDITINIW